MVLFVPSFVLHMPVQIKSGHQNKPAVWSEILDLQTLKQTNKILDCDTTTYNLRQAVHMPVSSASKVITVRCAEMCAL